MVNVRNGAVKTMSISELSIWDEAKHDRTLLSVVLELTARCNNNCVHCYINQPAGDVEIKNNELSFSQIKEIADEAVSLGTLWVLLSGGEPLLRPDFSDIYIYLKKKGLLVSVFTNGSQITEEHIKLFKKYPPRDLEITVYGVTEKTHKKVTGRKTYSATMAGIEMLIANQVPVTLKTTLLKSNIEEFDDIAQFCRSRSARPFRFDPFLNFRLDGDWQKNSKISSERLSFDEVIALEQRDPERLKLLQEKCHDTDGHQSSVANPKRIFRCQAGINSCCIDYAGRLKLCSSLANENCIYDLKNGSLTDAWEDFVPGIRAMESDALSFLDSCGKCSVHNICSWCPAHADLETGKLDGHIQYFCTMTQRRKESTVRQ